MKRHLMKAFFPRASTFLDPNQQFSIFKQKNGKKATEFRFTIYLTADLREKCGFIRYH